MKPEQAEYAAPGPGQCVLHNLGGRLWVERADPLILISATMPAHPDVRRDGAVLVIDGANQRVSYRLERSGKPGWLLGRLC